MSTPRERLEAFDTVLKFLMGRKGFSHWWDGIEDDIKQEIRDDFLEESESSAAPASIGEAEKLLEEFSHADFQLRHDKALNPTESRARYDKARSALLTALREREPQTKHQKIMERLAYHENELRKLDAPSSPGVEP